MKKRKIVVSAMLAAVPDQGGWAWAVLHYLLGLQKLGHDVVFVEPIAKAELLPVGTTVPDSYNKGYFHSVLADSGVERSSLLYLTDGERPAENERDDLMDLIKDSDILINISGRLRDQELIRRFPIRVYVDLDPAFTQLWHVAHDIDMGFDGHSHFVTIGEAIGTPNCTIPTCDLAWITSKQPIVLDSWPVVKEIVRNSLTTIANWRGYGSAEYQGIFYGQKVHSLRDFMTLPLMTTETFTLALNIHPDEVDDLKALNDNKWSIVNPSLETKTPAAYRRFIQGSKAEFGIAKSGYVRSRCGWFSDRSLCYLASGRPVIAQETGFSQFLPTGEGVFAFETISDVCEAIDTINRDYDLQSRLARSIAQRYFDSDIVLSRMLREIGAE